MKQIHKLAYGQKIAELETMVNSLINEGNTPIGGVADLGYLPEKCIEFKHRKFIVQPMLLTIKNA